MTDPIIDADYNSRSPVSDAEFDSIIRRYRSESDATIVGLHGFRNIPYDEHSAEKLDIWGSEVSERKPVVVAIHGGYWRALSRHDTAFFSRMLADHGVATVTVDYTLAPEASLQEIIRQVRAAISWIHTHGMEYGLDPNQIHVVGSSAGAHLAAMTAVGGWQKAAGVPLDVVKSAMPISGLFDLRPLVQGFPNEWLHLDDESAAAASPLLAPPGTARLFVADAEAEARGFHFQSRIFHDAWSSHGASESYTVPGRNHFDIFLDLMDPGSVLSKALLRLVLGDR